MADMQSSGKCLVNERIFIMTIETKTLTTTNIKCSEDLNDQHRLRRSAGFTLIELLAAVAIIAVLIALLLPVIQRRREAYAEAKAAENLTTLLLASNEYFALTGHYPNALADLRGLSATPAGGNYPLNLLLTTGRADGYRFVLDADGDGDVDGADFLVVAEPEYPGITGGLTLTIGADGTITHVQTPGADASRERMFDNIRAKAGETVVNLLNLNPSAYTQVRGYSQSPATVASVLQTLDGNDDNRVSINEVRFANTTFDDQALRNPLQGFLDFVAQEMKWDSLSQEAQAFIATDLPGTLNVASPEPELFSYDGLGRLTQTYSITVGPDINSLCANLAAAEAAERRGDQQGKAIAISAYQTAVRAQIGHSLTRNQASILMALSKTL
jgi:prepilin-type N-terminal cleavage/methylation domain-containing protein